MRKIYCASLLFVVFMITSCKVLFDLNETPVDVTYTVKYYLQNVEDDNYTFYESVQRKGKTGESVAEETREFEGFSKVSQETTTIESSIPIIVKVKYDRNYYKVNFYSDENADSSFIRSDNLKYESKINYPTNPEKEGFEFIGWSEKVEKVPSHDVKIFATWKAIETEDPEPEPEPEPVLPKDISYTVNYFEENIDDDNFTLVKTETLTGKEGDLTEVSPESKEGFADAVYKNVTLSDEENIVIDVKYSRKSYFVYFYIEDKIYYSFSGKYESEIKYPANPEREGYEFVKWDSDVKTIPSHHVDIKAVWEKIVEPEPVLPKDISYTVNYFEENIDDDNFTLVKTETLTGKEGDLTEVSPESKEGFADAVYKNVTLSDEENIVIDVKYSRKHYVIYFQLNDFELKTFAGKFGAKIQYPEIPERKGYYFVNWSENPIYVPAENLTIVANWKQKETAEYTINYYIQNIDDDDYEFFDSKVFEGKTNSYPHLTFTSKKGFTVTCDNEIIECDGSTVINAYYTRNYYTVYFLVDNNIYYTVNQKYESKIELPPEPFKEGYKFEKWNNVVDTVPNSNHYITAVFSTLKDVPYIINLMLQNIYDDEYTLYKVENGTGETNTYTQPWENDDIVGFDLKKCDSAIIKGDASTVINAYYDREIHSMTIDGKTITGRYGEEITVPKDPSKIGYTFNGWSESIPDTIQARDIEIVSTWVTKKDTPYKITFYYEGVESSDYSENESETLLLTGETDSIIEYDIPEVEGFTAKPLETYKIAADGSTVVKVKYKRNLYKVTFYNDEEVYLSYEYKYGEKVSDISFRGNKQGYIFKEWDISLPFTVPAHDVDIHAVWNPSTTMKYTVRTYKQKVDGETFEVNETVKYDGTTDALTDVSANKIKGFYCDPINQVIIAADGSSIVEVYYYRETHKVTIKDFYGPGIDKVIEGLYEANIQIDEEPFYSGYYVYSYNLDSRKTVYNLKSVTIDSIDLEYTCNWRKLEFEVSVYIPSGSHISNYSIQRTNEEEYLVFETSGDIEGKCTWYLNKKKVELIDGKCKILIKDLRPGYYNLLLVVENGDEVKTGNATFTVNSGV